MTTDSTEHIQLPDPAAELLLEREVRALKLITAVRFMLMLIMAPMVWWLGASLFERIATSSLLVVYTLVVCTSAYLISQRRYLKIVGLVGVMLDIALMGTLPLIWYATLGGSALPFGITLKTSVTAFCLLLITLNTLAMRPLYPLLATVGALLVHLILLALALSDERTAFTSSYLLAFTTPEIATGRVVTRITVVLLVGLMLTLLTMQVRKMIIEATHLQKANVQLGRYFSANLVRKLAENPALFRVGGERRDLSFVFTDLEGFTSMVESGEPATVVPLLNGYLDELVQVAFRHEGTVDKIVGDAVHVIFGAPVDQPDHASRAIACALEMDNVAEHYREQSDTAALGITRIGVNSGSAIVGNFGGDALFDYTAHGDAVNIAARLEGANKYLGTRICVSGDTASRDPSFSGRPVGTLWLKGKSQGIEVFEPLVNANEKTPALQAYLEAYELLRTEHPDALTSFTDVCERYPEDALARFHLNRLQSGQSGTRIVLDDK